MNLVIVESPTKAKTLSRFLGSDFMIQATMGHVRDLPEKKLGIDLEHDFKPDYVAIDKRKDRIKELASLASKSSRVILASDPDREGEAIAWHTSEVLEKNLTKGKGKDKVAPKFERITFHEITKSAILDALEHPREIDFKLVDAQQARRILDRLVGYKLSPLLWKKMGMRWLSAGRVQSVAVRLIVEREREIKAFNPVEYWVIDVELQNTEDRIQNSVNKTFLARLSEINGKKIEVGTIGNKESSDTILENLKTANYTVKDVVTKEVKRNPLPPFITSTLQQAASNRFGWTAKRTMRAAQSLYEEGHITYHRTDSTNLSTEAIAQAREFIGKEFDPQFLPQEPRIYKTKSKVAQEAHEAIRPTNVRLMTEADLKIHPIRSDASSFKMFQSAEGRDSELLYGLIWKRFLSCQMSEALFDQKSITIAALAGTNSYTLKVGGQTVKFPGWTVLYPKANDDAEKDEEGNSEVPDVKVADPLTYIKTLAQQKFTEPPPRFNEASLIKALEEKGIGRPSTYAPIITTIQDRKYVEKIEKKFMPTDLGNVVTDFLVKNFPQVFDITFTASMEDALDSVANGQREWVGVIRDFYTPFGAKLEEVGASGEKISVSFGTTDEKCPNCGKPLAIKMSRFGKFLACTGFPACTFKKSIIEKAGILCPKDGGEMLVKKTRTGKQFYGCANYPTCTFAAWKKEDIK